MKIVPNHHTSSVFVALAMLAAASAAGAPASHPGSGKGDIVFAPNKGALTNLEQSDSRAVRVTFPTPMVDLDRVQRSGQPSPVLFDPVVELRWTWVSQTEGKITFPGYLEDEPHYRVPMRRVVHRAQLRPGLKDLDGNPVDPQNWGIQFADDQFAVSGVEFLNVFDDDTDVDTREKSDADEDGEKGSNDDDAVERRKSSAPLVARPRVRLEFSRDVLPQDVVNSVRFEDRQTHERFPIEVNLEERQAPGPQGWMLVEPRAPLPAGRSILLVVDPLKTPGSQESLQHILVVPAGSTFPMKIRRVVGFNQPLVGAFVRVTVNHTIDPDPANLKRVKIQPAVANLRIVSHEYSLDLEGAFDTRAEYRVTLQAGLKSTTSYDLEKDSAWKVHFHPKRPAIILPQAESAQRASTATARCSFTQVNTGPLEWKVAKIPSSKLLEVRARVREFGEPLMDKEGNKVHDPNTGEYRYGATELLIPRLGLPVVDSGQIEGSGDDKETAGEFEWKAATTEPGLYLVEISGKDLRGRTIGNRSIISRSDWVISEIESPQRHVVRVVSAIDGKPVAGTSVQFVGRESFIGTPVVTDGNGESLFNDKVLRSPGGESPDAMLVGALNQECLQLTNQAAFGPADPAGSGHGDQAETRCVIVTDRNVYKPGETVKFKGFIRQAKAGRLSTAAGEPIEWGIWQLDREDSDKPALFESTTPVTARGSWEGTWEIPKIANGDYFIRAGGASAKIVVGEFRPPPFSVSAEVEKVAGDILSLRVSSVHFHGAPNAGAKVRWKAEWLVDNWRDSVEDVGPGDRFALDDQHSPDSPSRGISGEFLRGLAKAGWDTERQDREVRTSAQVQGETKLDANGTATFACQSPFPAGAAYGRAKVFCFVAVTSVGAQTVRGGTEARVQFVPKVLGVRLEAAGDKKVSLDVSSFDGEDERSPGLAAKAELFRVDTKTVKERLGPNLNRYRNFPAFEKVWEGDLVTPARNVIMVPTPGSYIARVKAPQQRSTPQVSDATIVSGKGQSELPVDNESSLRCTPDRPRYDVGDTATITVEAPFPGVATLKVETDRVLFQQVLSLNGNAQRISLPVQASFAPNAYVSLDLIKPAAGTALPAERYGWCEIKVQPDEQRLQVTTTLKAKTVEPGSDVSGIVTVKASGRRVAGSDVLLFAVDEAVLALGRWKLPDFFETFFPRRKWQVLTHGGLGRLWNTDNARNPSHSQKGFILGDVGSIVNHAIFRKEFKALAFWNASLTTNASGEVPFAFKAPDALTSYRVVAVAQNGTEQFGQSETQVRLAKKLQVEPALPDFLRRGDEVVLRALVRQDYADSDEIDVAVAVGPDIQLAVPALQRITAKRRVPVLVGFRGKVLENATRAKIGFAIRSATSPEIKDAEENTFGVYPSRIEKRSTVFGSLTPSNPLPIASVVPAEWLQAKGQCDIYLSGSSFLSKMAGLPALLEAEGSIEKIATKILAGTLLAETLKYLPREPAADEMLRRKVQDGLKRFAQTVLDDGGLPAWQGGTKLDEFATVQAAWAIRNAHRLGYPDTAPLDQRASDWLSKIIHKKSGFDQASPDIQCFALMVAGQTRDVSDKDAETFEAEGRALFDNRQQLTDEGRAWLALATHYFDILPDERKVLLREMDQPVKAIEFDPVTLSSQTRSDAIRLLARSEIESTNWSRAMRDRARQSFDAISKSSISLSTEENLWLLLAFNSLAQGEVPAAMAKRVFSPKPGAISKNGISVGWLGIPLERMSATFSRPLQPGVGGSYLVRANYELPDGGRPAPDPSLSLDRTARNLTDPSRNGSAESPFALGDEILVTYKLEADKPHSYVEVEDQLPACFETVNPNFPMVASYFQLPIEAGVNTLPLSHVELRFTRTLLYFEKTKPGRNLYSVLARVTTAGTFHWPATQVRPMYDSRFWGVSASMLVYAQ